MLGRDGLQRAEFGPVQVEADRAAGAPGGGGDQAPAGPEQGGAGGQHGSQRVGQSAGPDEQLGVLLEDGEVGQLSDQTVLQTGRLADGQEAEVRQHGGGRRQRLGVGHVPTPHTVVCVTQNHQDRPKTIPTVTTRH